MSKRKTLFTYMVVCFLGLFLPSIPSGPAYAMDERSEESSETSDALQQQQDSPVDYKSRGRSYLEKGQNDDAISDFDKAIALNPKDAETYFFRGNAYYNKRQFDKAMSDYSKAIEINPRYTNAYYSRGLYYQTIEEYRKAISDFDEVIKIDPENAYAYYYRGCAHFAKEKYRKALSDYNKAIKIDPEYVNPYINRGDIKIVADVPAEWSKEVGLTKMQQILVKTKDIDLVICGNDAVAAGAIIAIEAAGLTPGKDIYLTGVDVDPDGIQLVKEGKIICTVVHEARLLGYWAVDMMMAYLEKGKTPPKDKYPDGTIRVLHYIADKTNIDNIEAFGDFKVPKPGEPMPKTPPLPY